MASRTTWIPQITSALLGFREPPELTTLPQLQDWALAYVKNVVYPVSKASPESRAHYVRLLRTANLLSSQAITNPTSQFHSMDRHLCQLAAFVTGLLFLLSFQLNSGRAAVKQIAPYTPPSWHQAMYFGGNQATAFADMLDLLLRASFGSSQDDWLLAGWQYVETHVDADPGEYYIGSCNAAVQKGSLRGAPRWPYRHAAHAQCTASIHCRDADAARYRIFRGRGIDGQCAFPVYGATMRAAYSREVHIISARRDQLLQHRPEQHIHHKHRPDHRRRPLPSVRRRIRQLLQFPKSPALRDNFNTASHYGRLYPLPSDHDGTARPKNFVSMYRDLSRQFSSETGTVAAPLDPRREGLEPLLLEYAATPGKRLPQTDTQLSRQQVLKMANHLPRVRGPYRQRLAARKVGFLARAQGLPSPELHRIKIRRTMFWLASAVKQTIRLLLTAAKLVDPQLGQLTQTHTRVCPGRDRKHTEAFVDEYAATASFNLRFMQSIDPNLRSALASTYPAHVVAENYDSVVQPSRSTMRTELLTELRKWRDHFGLAFTNLDLQKAAGPITQATASLPMLDSERRPPEIAPHEDLVDEVWKPWMTGRVDHNVHALMQRPLLAYHCSLYQLYCADTKTFEVTSWTVKRTLRFMRFLYYTEYPERFRTRCTWTEESIPRAIVRGKSKCLGPTGLECERPGHIHERLIVNTASLPSRRNDRFLNRCWQIAKQADPLPSFEVWNMAKTLPQHSASRGQLVAIDDFRTTCMKCREQKPEIALARYDCGSLYTHANLAVFRKTEAPQCLQRVSTKFRRHTVTLNETRQVSGRVGGKPEESWKRRVATHNELLAYATYMSRLVVFMLGSGKHATIILQKMGCFMGGRFSKMITSLLLGGGEGRLWTDRPKLERLGFVRPGMDIASVVSLLRIVDDGAIASKCLCVSCLGLFLQEAWGKDQIISLEESGTVIKFGDMIETWNGQAFVLTPHFHNSRVGFEWSKRTTRYIPLKFQAEPRAYIRSLMIGRLHRIHQVSPGDANSLIRALTELCYELNESPNEYSWSHLRNATYGILLPFAVGTLPVVRGILRFLEGLQAERTNTKPPRTLRQSRIG